MPHIFEPEPKPEKAPRLRRTYWKLENLDEQDSGDQIDMAYVSAEKAEANLVASRTNVPVVGTDQEWHLPVFDLDYGVKLVESSTPGHYHLYLNKPVPWRVYKRVLKALAAAGLVQQKWVEASIKRGMSTVRPPWVKKKSVEGEDSAPFMDEDGEILGDVDVPTTWDPKPQAEGVKHSHPNGEHSHPLLTTEHSHPGGHPKTKPPQAKEEAQGAAVPEFPEMKHSHPLVGQHSHPISHALLTEHTHPAHGTYPAN